MLDASVMMPLILDARMLVLRAIAITTVIIADDDDDAQRWRDIISASMAPRAPTLMICADFVI